MEKKSDAAHTAWSGVWMQCKGVEGLTSVVEYWLSMNEALSFTPALHVHTHMHTHAHPHPHMRTHTHTHTCTHTHNMQREVVEIVVKSGVSCHELTVFFYCCVVWMCTVTFAKVLKIHHSWIQPLRHSPLFLLPLIPTIVSKGLIFPFTYMSTQYLPPVHALTHFTHILPPYTGTNLPNRTWTALLFSNFVKKKKKWHFCFV
jgi:hypothetical protein